MSTDPNELEKNKSSLEDYETFIADNKALLNHQWIWNAFSSYITSKSEVLFNFIKAIFKFSKNLEYSKKNHFDSELSMYSIRLCLLIFKADNIPIILPYLKNPDENISYGMLAYIVKAITDPDHFSLTRRIRLKEKEIKELTNSLKIFSKKYFLGKDLNQFIFYDFLGFLAWTEIDHELKEYILNEVRNETEVFFKILDIFSRPIEVNINELDKKLSYKELKNIIDSKLGSVDISV